MKEKEAQVRYLLKRFLRRAFESVQVFMMTCLAQVWMKHETWRGNNLGMKAWIGSKLTMMENACATSK
ncbi:unnamed protein product [Lathyrus sativus]|nr:unnamed protein product [Lathyrus sativus]